MQQNHPPGYLTYNRNIVLCADKPAPGRTLTSMAEYGIWYGVPRVVAGRRRMPGERIAPAPERAGADRRRQPC